MAILALQPSPAGPGKDLWHCRSPTELPLSASKPALEHPPPSVGWVTALLNAPVNSRGCGDDSRRERMRSCSIASCAPTALCTPDVHASTEYEAQRQICTFPAGRQSDEDKDRRSVMERSCQSKLKVVYEYIALVIRSDDGFYASFPDIKTNGGWSANMEDVKQNLKELLLSYAEEVVLGIFPVPPAKFRTLDDYEEIEGGPMPADERERFHCLLPCSITFEEIKAWMAQESEECDPYWLSFYMSM